MRDSLNELLKNTIIFQYTLPTSKIKKTDLSTRDDSCYSATTDADLSKLIYNGISEYALGEKHVDLDRLQVFQRKAIKSRLRFNETASDETKLKYGFYGEVVLDLLLQYVFQSNVLLAKGYFYSPLEGSEPKGYDSYQFLYSEEGLSLILGEVKFYQSYKEAIKKILDNLEKAASIDYFNKNVTALINEKGNFETCPAEITSIIEGWENDPDINLHDEVIEHQIKLYYPMLVLFDRLEGTYDDSIEEIVGFIDNELKARSMKIEMDIDLLFMFLPVNCGKAVKGEVIKWISQNNPVE